MDRGHAESEMLSVVVLKVRCVEIINVDLLTTNVLNCVVLQMAGQLRTTAYGHSLEIDLPGPAVIGH